MLSLLLTLPQDFKIHSTDDYEDYKDKGLRFFEA